MELLFLLYSPLFQLVRQPDNVQDYENNTAIRQSYYIFGFCFPASYSDVQTRNLINCILKDFLPVFLLLLGFRKFIFPTVMETFHQLCPIKYLVFNWSVKSSFS